MTIEREDDSLQALEEIQSLPGADDLMALYENLEEVYRQASLASSIYEDNGLTTSYTDIPPRHS